MELDIDIHNLFDLLKESYKCIDFISIFYKENEEWNRFLTILRFSNESEVVIKKRYEKLKLYQYNTDKLRIDYKILRVSEWEEKIIDIYDELNEEFDIYDYDDFRFDNNKYDKFMEEMYSEVKIFLNTPNRRFYLTENELKKHNLITFNIGFNTNNKHLIFSTIANREILLLGDDNIYDVVNRAFQLDGYSSNNNLGISIIFPIYFKIDNLHYSQKLLSGKITYHNTYQGSKIFFRIYSEPNFREDFFVGDKNLIIGEGSEENDRIFSPNNGLIEKTFSISFEEFDCNPNFKIRVYWDKIKTNIIDFQKSFDTPIYERKFVKLNSEIPSEENKLKNSQNFQIKEKFIDIDFADYDLKYYEAYVKIINEIAGNPDFYIILPNLLRTLFENLLQVIFSQSLHHSCSDLYYRQGERYQDFSKLIGLLGLLKDDEFGPYISGKITKNIIDEINEIREKGNITIHDVMPKITPSSVNEIKDKIKISLKPLLVAYKNLHGKNIKVDNNRSYQIKLKLRIIKEEKREEKKKSKKRKKSFDNIQIADKSKISNLMAEIRVLIDNDSSNNINIRNKMDELLLNVRPLINNRQRDALGRMYVLFNYFVESGFKDTSQTLFDAINKIILG